ncbi:MAG TPA: MBL fold metallo-hydrolase [Pseudonocardiaceae bacterium]|jgi:L-ascorbate metabolism protein UlaG (beta-lactamase superfamily)
MQITHYGHACLLVQTGSARLLIDPGIFSSGFESARELTAVLITHQHADHLDVERLPALLAANPGVQLITDTASAEQLAERDIEARAVVAGERLELGGSVVDAVGGRHAMIHPDLPVIPNVGYLVDDTLLHPGDSFHVPDRPVAVLGVPTGAPWLKAAEAIDYLRAVSPRIAVPIHEAVLARPQMMYGLLENLKPDTTTFRVLPRGEAIEV